jgi:hypothetical protein
MKQAVGKKVTKKYMFGPTEIQIAKLSVSDVFKIEALSKELFASKGVAVDTADGPSGKISVNPVDTVVQMDEGSKAGLDLLKAVIVMSVEDAKDLDEEEWLGFAFEELQSLSEAIMAYSGMGGDGAKVGKPG